MKSLDEVDFTIIGLGLMGASLAAALRPHCRSIFGVDADPEAVSWARSQGWIDGGDVNLDKPALRSNVIILATPVRAILSLLDQITPHLAPGTLVTDLGSTKGEVCQKMGELPPSIQAIGGHPLCGRETPGGKNADPHLFTGRAFVLCPLPSTQAATLQFMQSMIQAIGAYPLIIDAQTHDRLVSITSHLPYLLACTLVNTAASQARLEPTLWRVAASGFRDTSRLAASEVTMMLDILLTNRENILAALQKFNHGLETLFRLIEEGQESALHDWLEEACEERRRRIL
jgi:prephenate dehydrogenase